MTAFEMPPLISNPNESYQVNIIACASITWLIAAIFVVMRFYTRGYLLKNVLGTEDWLILLAIGFSGATSAGLIEQSIYGLGKHTLDIDPEVMMPMARAGWYSILWYMMALLFTKISILMLYIRILSYQHARYAVYAIMAIVVLGNGLWTLITVATACTPLQAFWDPSIPNAYCRSAEYWYANTGLHIGTDILLYVLPLPVIINLQIKTRQKVFLYSIFAVGFFVCTISAVRLWDLVEEYKRPDFTYDNVSIAYLTCLEVNSAIACACCMTLKPLIVRLFPGPPESRKRNSGRDLEANRLGRGPPTIGSKPSRMEQKKGSLWIDTIHHQKSDSNVQLLDEDDVIGSRDAKHSSDLESPGTMSVDYNVMLAEPPAAHTAEKSSRGVFTGEV
ncbi:hypothetical protein B0T17DRAFT_482492 [Bombardia bombarda]|uniref:Rhodopsin domain-containing protein n=1 Tax=Bombardia bombarda TaxID=252184 RepID=A0AA40CGF9_9PEZI|nr:hypothetical protein B0T17DRAFT_482492 [Bombardia bombarda]